MFCCCFRSDTVSMQQKYHTNAHSYWPERIKFQPFKRETGHRQITSLSGNLLPLAHTMWVCVCAICALKENAKHKFHRKISPSIKFYSEKSVSSPKMNWKNFSPAQSKALSSMEFMFNVFLWVAWDSKSQIQHSWLNEQSFRWMFQVVEVQPLSFNKSLVAARL